MVRLLSSSGGNRHLSNMCAQAIQPLSMILTAFELQSKNNWIFVLFALGKERKISLYKQYGGAMTLKGEIKKNFGNT